MDSIISRLKSFSFFDSTKNLPKTKTNTNSKQKKSCSFCFSSQFLRLQVNLLRPLDKISRFSISKFVNLYNLPLLIDITNFSSSFSRNKIRHQLIPFIRSLIHLNVEYLVINFLKMISQEHQDTEKGIQELSFIYKILTLRFSIKRTEFAPSLNLEILRRTLKRKKPTSLKKHLEGYLVTVQAKPNLSDWVEKYSIKALLKKNLELKTRTLLQIFFFDYKNVNLSYPQILKLHDFYCRKNKKTV